MFCSVTHARRTSGFSGLSQIRTTSSRFHSCADMKFGQPKIKAASFLCPGFKASTGTYCCGSNGTRPFNNCSISSSIGAK